MIKAKIVSINQIISNVTSNIKNNIDNTGEVSVQTNIGKISGIAFLSNLGLKFSMKMETSRTE